MSNSYSEIEEQEGTRIEKVLLFALVAFLLVGGFWVFSRIESLLPAPELQNVSNYSELGMPNTQALSIEEELGIPKLRNEVQKLQKIADNRQATLANVLAAQSKAEEEYKFRREEYRTAMQAGTVTKNQRSVFEAKRATFQVVSTHVLPAQAAVDGATKRVADTQSRLNSASNRARDVLQIRSFQRNVKLFAIHFSYAACCLGLSWALWQSTRRRRWRYQTIATALFTASVLQLLFLLFRYSWTLVLEDFAVLGVAAMGSIICILAIVAIKRWLFSPERLAEARLSARRCVTCATPFVESQSHCWKCGKPVVERCASCGANRLVFAPHCGSCGSSTSVPPVQ